MSPNPFRCFDGNTPPHTAFWRFVDAASSESGQTELELDGVISEYSWFGDEITPKMFKNDLYNRGQGGPVLLKINSPGGDVIAASRMRAIMTDYPGEITARVDGMAASAAVIVTLAAKTINIMDSAYMMIHDPAVVVFLASLDIETLGKLRDDLRTIKDGIVPAYAARTGLSEEQIARMMTRETWMNARDAVEFGFADAIIEGGQKKPAASNVAYVNCFRNYANIPADLIPVNAPPTGETTDQAPAPASPPDADKEREAQTLRNRVTEILSKEIPHA